jgi:hypothetical protein
MTLTPDEVLASTGPDTWLEAARQLRAEGRTEEARLCQVRAAARSPNAEAPNLAERDPLALISDDLQVQLLRRRTLPTAPITGRNPRHWSARPAFFSTTRRVESALRVATEVVRIVDQTPRHQSPTERPKADTRAFIGLEYGCLLARLGCVEQAREAFDASLNQLDRGRPVIGAITTAYFDRALGRDRGIITPLTAIARPLPQLDRYRIRLLVSASPNLDTLLLFGSDEVSQQRIGRLGKNFMARVHGHPTNDPLEQLEALILGPPTEWSAQLPSVAAIAQEQIDRSLVLLTAEALGVPAAVPIVRDRFIEAARREPLTSTTWETLLTLDASLQAQVPADQGKIHEEMLAFPNRHGPQIQSGGYRRLRGLYSRMVARSPQAPERLLELMEDWPHVRDQFSTNEYYCITAVELVADIFWGLGTWADAEWIASAVP